jgi:hypothetical protein
MKLPSSVWEIFQVKLISFKISTFFGFLKIRLRYGDERMRLFFKARLMLFQM